MTDQLKLGMDDGGLRHSLTGLPVGAGTPLEVQLQDGAWLPGIYEWSFDEAKPPYLTILLAGGQEPASLRLPPGALLRWSDETGGDAR